MAEVTTPTPPSAPSDEGEATTSTPPTNQGKKISLNILHTVKTSQMQFGLRHADYQRYRKYCSRRLTRIRKSLKFTHQTGAKGTSMFQKKPVEPHMVTDERYFLLILFRCERAFAYSMQLKQDMEIQTTNSRLVHHQLRRLDKAAKYAQALERISIRADEHTALDATAYAGYMQGVVALERSQWETALTHLAKASTIYNKLGSISGTETNQLCKDKVDEIDHRIRFCLQYLRKAKGQGAPESKDEKETKDLIARLLKGHEDLTSKLDSVVSDAAKKSPIPPNSEQHEVSWKGQRLGIQNEKLQTLLLVTAQKLARDLESEDESTLEAKLSLFEQLFGIYADAMKIIKEETTSIQKNSTKGKAKDPQELNLNLLQEYVTYLKLVANVQRSVLLADSASITAVTDVSPVPTAIKKKHPDEMVRLYENVIHGMGEIDSILNQSSSANANATPAPAPVPVPVPVPVLSQEDTADTNKLTQAKLVLYKASRCYWLAQSFATLQKTDKALALFDRASSHAEQAKHYFSSTKSSTSADRARLERLEKDITAARAKSRAKAFIATLEAQTATATTTTTTSTTKQQEGKKATSSSSSSSSTASTSTITLAAGLNTYDASFLSDKRLADFPPNLEAIPCKPLLFDLAVNECTFPNLEARKKTPQKKGLLGYIWG